MYRRAAGLYDTLYGFQDCAGAAERLHDLIQQQRPEARTLLDVACGTGRHLEHLRGQYQVEGLDTNAEMIEIARRRCPGVPFHHADMLDFCLAERFDVVTCLFSSVAYGRTLQNLDRAIKRMAAHLVPGGLLFVEPYFTPESYWVGYLKANFAEEPDLKIAWMYLNGLKDRLSVLDIHYLVATPEGVEHFTEVHELGLYTHQEYLDSFRKAGLRVSHDDVVGLFDRGLYTGVNT